MDADNVIIKGIFKKSNSALIFKIIGLFFLLLFVLIHYLKINLLINIFSFINKYLFIYISTTLIVIGSLLTKDLNELVFFNNHVYYYNGDKKCDLLYIDIKKLVLEDGIITIHTNKKKYHIKNLINAYEIINTLSNLKKNQKTY